MHFKVSRLWSDYQSYQGIRIMVTDYAFQSFRIMECQDAVFFLPWLLPCSTWLSIFMLKCKNLWTYSYKHKQCFYQCPATEQKEGFRIIQNYQSINIESDNSLKPCQRKNTDTYYHTMIKHTRIRTTKSMSHYVFQNSIYGAKLRHENRIGPHHTASSAQSRLNS